MEINRSLCCLCLVAFTTSACAFSKSKDQPQEREEDAQVFDSSSNSTLDDAGDPVRSGVGGSGRVPSAGTSGSSSYCGNGIAEDLEECDDGNLDDQDGCTNLCEFTCVSDEECDDSNNCNGVEVCTQNACDDSDPDLQEGAECDENKSCWQGVCVPNVCGDAKKDPGELCDDGNLDPDDGCTPDCEFTCEDHDDCAEKDECFGDVVCEDHKCVVAEMLDDKTPCSIVDERTKGFCGDDEAENDGWCIRGVCTCSGCGDGEVEGIEECDDGLLNGTAESSDNCSRHCRVVACGNGVLEGDDGNHRRMDGCDPDCRYEFAHRFTHIEILKGIDVPYWCKHSTNRLADAFTEEVMLMGVERINTLGTINKQLHGRFASQTAMHDSFYVLQILNSSDTSMITADNEIAIGLYQGSLYNEPMEDPLDPPVVIEATHLYERTLLPSEYHTVPALQAGGGRVLSAKPTVVELPSIAGGFWLMHDFTMQLVFDMGSLSLPNTEPLIARDSINLSEQVRLPELAGEDPMGLFCGAIGQGLFNQPVVGQWTSDRTPPLGAPARINMCCKNNGDQFAMPYRNCDGGVLTDECDSMTDMIHQGCTACFGDYSDPATFENQPQCELMKTNPESCITFINGIDYDIDSDGDGENDSWSALFGFKTQRVVIFGVKEE